MNFEVAAPLRIQTQTIADECTSCALAAIAEDVLKVPVDPNFIYQNSSDGQFGITADQAISAVLNKGVVPLGETQVVFPFKNSTWAWPWIFRFDSIISLMQKNQRSVFAGIYWQDEWFNIPGGVMTVPSEWTTYFAHAFKIFGAAEINGKIYLKVQNSLGPDKGDHGIWYMPKEVATKLNFAYQLL